MATGDGNDIVSRLKRELPPSWFSSDTLPVLNSIITGVSSPLSWIYSLYLYTIAQMRIATSSGIWIDRISYDFLGARLLRRNSEQDAIYKARVTKEIMRPRQTVSAISLALQDLTGAVPQIFEPWNPADCGAYGFALGYGCGGCYGSTKLTNQVFVNAFRPNGQGVPNVGGYGTDQLAYGVAGEYISQAQVTGPVTDAEIYDTVAHTKAAGMTAWVAIDSALPTQQLDSSHSITADLASITCDDGLDTSDHC